MENNVEKTKGEYFVNNRFTEQMTTMDCEKFENNLKRIFQKVDSNDWEYCHKCFLFGSKDCHKACSVMMKNLYRVGKINETSSATSKPGRVVSAEESIGNASYAQSSQSEWDERVVSDVIPNATDSRTLGGVPDDEENM